MYTVQEDPDYQITKVVLHLSGGSELPDLEKDAWFQLSGQ
jgi:hypothetical protein